MNITSQEYKFLSVIAKVFSPAYSTGNSWLIAGLWREAQEMLISLLTKRATLTPHQIREAGLEQFSFPFKTAYVSYQNSISDKHATYYQQRFHATEVDEIITLKQFLYAENVDYSTVHQHYKLLDQFKLRHLLNQEVIKLSNGETRKASVLKALLNNPQVLILDNPFAGIDQKTAPELDNLFNELAKNGLSLILISNTEMPVWVSNVLWTNSPENIEIFPREDFLIIRNDSQKKPHLLPRIKIPPVANPSCRSVVKLNNVSVSYGEKVILKNINWEISAREKWLLTGKNGAGKSTLLSLIYADHPQSYANNIELFGKKRGSGESVWDIKEKIAFYSPEFYFYFDKTSTCREAILSAIYFHPFEKGTRNIALENFAQELFLLFFNKENLHLPLHKLSGVHQRLTLLLRALAQNAPLVLLDEPFQGFDQELTEKCKQLTELCCHGKTLIFVSHHPGDVPKSVEKEFKLSPAPSIF